MAVRDEYVNSDVANDKKGNAAFVNGAEVIGMQCTMELAAGDDDGSVLRLFKSLPGTLIPVAVHLNCDALTGCTDVDCGFYVPGVGGAEIDKDILRDGVDISAGNSSRITPIDLLATLNIDKAQKSIAEICGDDINERRGYDLCLTFNTIGSGAGTISVFALFLQG